MRPNPIFEQPILAVNPDQISADCRFDEGKDLNAAQLLKLFRGEKAREFLGTLAKDAHVIGLTKGQFSLVDVIREISSQLGPADLALSTWTVARADLTELQELLASDRFTRIRFLLDFSFQRRQPALIEHIRKTFGAASVVVTKNHAKFLLVRTAKLSLVVRTSMNLNFNPRLEDLDIKEDARLYDFFDSILENIFTVYAKKNQAKDGAGVISKEFTRLIR
jgi:hypothetical protein